MARRAVIRNCLNVCSLSIAAVMAGSGDLGLLKKLRTLQISMKSSDYHFGNHLAVNMSIGLLFLGGGRHTLATDDRAVAFLFCALYPKFPLTPTDNRYHLAPFRHLWALCVVDRCLITRDFESKHVCRVPIVVSIMDDQNEDVVTQVSLTTPCSLPDFSRIKSVRIDSLRYWPLYLSRQVGTSNFEHMLKTLNMFVLRKRGYLDYLRDPAGRQGISCADFDVTVCLYVFDF
jgi:anaphase-promoting complex subunit 1